jgi:ribosome biogenesis protein UTP30
MATTKTAPKKAAGGAAAAKKDKAAAAAVAAAPPPARKTRAAAATTTAAPAKKRAALATTTAATAKAATPPPPTSKKQRTTITAARPAAPPADDNTKKVAAAPRRRGKKGAAASADVRAALLASRHLRPPQRAEAAAKAALSLPGVSRPRVERACASLIRFAGDRAEREAASPGGALPMGDDVADEALQLLIALKKAPDAGGKRKDKPVQLDVPHPMWTLNNGRGGGGGGNGAAAGGVPPAQICLFVRDDNKGSGHRAAKLRLSKIEGGAGIARVVGTSKLRGKYESHEAKRKLCAAYDLFLADDRILPSLPKLLGKQFFKRRKQPIPVRLSGGPGTGWRDLPAAAKRAAASAHLLPPRGTTVTVRCARVAHGAVGAADNVLAALAGVVARIPKGWANVAAVYVKTSDSVALPVYQSAAEAPREAEAERAAAMGMLLKAKKKQREGGCGGGGEEDVSE